MSRHGQCKRGLLFHGQTSGIRVMIPLERCETSGKIMFGDQDSAEAAASEYANNSAFFATAYRCKECSSWHLTKRGYNYLL